MERYKKLLLNLYSADLFYGKVELNLRHYSFCYFIVQHTNDMDFIKDQALQLLLSSCSSFEFVGTQAPIWQQGFNETYSLLHPNADQEKLSNIAAYNTIDEFTDSLFQSMSCRGLIPTDHYLIYDDREIYEDVLRDLQKKLWTIRAYQDVRFL